jgi:hypothetical protein
VAHLQALAIGKKTFKEQICFDLNGSKVKCEEHVKRLGVSSTVTIDYALIKILKRMGPRIEPSGTPLYTVSKELQIFFTFTHCFLPDK